VRARGARATAGLVETAAVTAGLALLAVAVLGPYVTRGGFAWDDWENAATTAYPPRSGFLGPLDLGTFAFRPLLALLIVGAQGALGPHPAPHLALALVLAVAMSAALFTVLRELGVERAPAAAAAALTLLFPWSDSTRLWATAALNDVAVMLWLAGLWLSLRALRSEGSRARAGQAGAIALYAASILVYQATAAVIAVSVLAVARRAGRLRAGRGALVACAAAVPIGAAAVVGLWAVDAAHSLADVGAHAVRIASEALVLIGRSVVPAGGVGPGAAGGALLAALALTAVWAFRPGASPSAGGRSLRRSLALAAGGLGVLACAYAVFVPADERYVPLAPGTANRVNLVAAIGYALIVTGTAWAVGAGVAAAVRGGVARMRRRAVAASPLRSDDGLKHQPTALATAVALVAVSVIAGAWAAVLRADALAWERASALRGKVVRAVERRAPELRPGTTVLTVGHPPRVEVGVPVFATAWDLNGAVKVVLADARMSARPLTDRDPLRCERRTLEPAPTYNSIPERPAYGRTVVLDVATGRARWVRSRHDCRRLAREAAAGRLHVVVKRVP
jgi:hypothetical protein